MANIQMQCLSSRFITFTELNKNKRCDKRYPEQALQKFITLNHKAFSFLGVNVAIQEREGHVGLAFTSGKFVGCAPLRTPVNGKYYLDFVVTSRFGEDIADIANLLQSTLEPEYGDMTLVNSSEMRAPVYLGCINYFNSFNNAMKCIWNKFDTIKQIENVPASSTNWTKYANNSYNPMNTFDFENRKNIQSKNHLEWYKLTYILKLAIELFQTPLTPISIKFKTKTLVDKLRLYSASHNCESTTEAFMIHDFDPIAIKDLKIQANKLLNHKSRNKFSWRIDSAELFERFAQYIVQEVGKKLGAKTESNARYHISGNNPAWALRYLEPDILLVKEGYICTIDAKYKAHMFNTSASTNGLRDSFRQDLHQVLAYSAFDLAKNKDVMILYPCNKFKSIPLSAISGYTNIRNKITLVGLPFNSKEIRNMINKLSETILGKAGR